LQVGLLQAITIQNKYLFERLRLYEALICDVLRIAHDFRFAIYLTPSIRHVLDRKSECSTGLRDVRIWSCVMWDGAICILIIPPHGLSSRFDTYSIEGVVTLC